MSVVQPPHGDQPCAGPHLGPLIIAHNSVTGYVLPRLIGRQACAVVSQKPAVRDASKRGLMIRKRPVDGFHVWKIKSICIIPAGSFRRRRSFTKHGLLHGVGIESITGTEGEQNAERRKGLPLLCFWGERNGPGARESFSGVTKGKEDRPRCGEERCPVQMWWGKRTLGQAGRQRPDGWHCE